MKRKRNGSMKLDFTQLSEAMVFAAQRLIDARDVLTIIDNLTGDGDLGISMEKVGYCILDEFEHSSVDNFPDALLHLAKQININAASTMGTLMSFSIAAVAKELKRFDDIPFTVIMNLPHIMVETIMICGRAQLGDKTVLDALIPYAQTYQEVLLETMDVKKAASDAANRAVEAALSTRGTYAKIGRAKWIAERSKDCVDGGATVCAIVAKALVGQPIDLKAFHLSL